MLKSELKRFVQEELKWEPTVDETSIGVEVSEEGVVTLTGHARTYSEKLNAEKAVKKVRGVMAVANDIEVRLTGKLDDTILAENAAHVLALNSNVPDQKIKVLVQDGWVTLEGEVGWEYQRREAMKAIRQLAGVRGITTRITLIPPFKPSAIKESIRAAFERNALVDANRVYVTAEGSKVVLTGGVHSWQERTEAERQAWAAPGVTAVENKLLVEAFAPAIM